jgi:hypothetical protein
VTKYSDSNGLRGAPEAVYQQLAAMLTYPHTVVHMHEPILNICLFISPLLFVACACAVVTMLSWQRPPTSSSSRCESHKSF